MGNDFFYIAHWWILLFLFGIFFLPITGLLFKAFFDKGYVFSKIIGLIVVSYLVFLMGTLHITPFTQATIILIGILCAIGNGILISSNTSFFSYTKQKKQLLIFLFEEVVFFCALWFWSYVRAFKPDIHELEKYMDFGFVNSILRTTYFPPKDMWFPSFSINYYYFGHFVTAVLTKLSGISSNITFNLMLATLFAFCFIGSFSLGANLWYLLKKQDISSQEKTNEQEKFSPQTMKIKKKHSLAVFFTGLLSALLVTFSGNLHVLYAFFKSYGNENPVPLWTLPFLPYGFPNSYWYPNATRFIYHTIHEFPMYSFVVSDLHGHVLDIPFVLLTLALLLSLLSKHQITNPKPQTNSTHQSKRKFETWNLFGIWDLGFGTLPLIGFLLAIMYMTNAWDGLMYFLLAVIVIGYITYKKTSTSIFANEFLSDFLPKAIIIFICFFLFSLPFSIFFQAGSIVHGIGVLCAPPFLTNKGKLGPFLFEVNHCQHSPWWELLTLYGFFYIWTIPFIIFISNSWRHTAHSSLFKTILSYLSFQKKNNKIRGKNYSKPEYSKHTQTTNVSISDIFVLLLILFSTLLIIIPEFVYLKDIYPEHYRANTMFKLVYQAFIMLSLASGYSIVRFFAIFKTQQSRVKQILFTVCYALPAAGLIALVAGLYPYFAISSYYGNLNSQTYQSLNGTAYLKSLYPTDYAAINWLNTNIHGQPIILEAQGDSYTDYARVSANTGLPTVLGWTVHEWLWRGSYDIPSPRITDVQTLYTTTDIPTTQTLIKRYNIKLVFVGDMERKKYPTLQTDKFAKLGKIIYQNGTTMIYQLMI